MGARGMPQPDDQQAQPQQPPPQPDQISQGLDVAAQHYQQQLQANTPAPPSGGPVRNMLQRFFSGMGAGMMHEAGLQTPQELQQQAVTGLQGVANAKGMLALHQQQIQQMQTVPFPLGDGTTVDVARKDIGALVGRLAANASRVQVQGMKNDIASPLLTPEQAQAIGHPELAGQEFGKAVSGIVGQQAGKVVITPDMVGKYNMPSEAVGKYAKLSDILSAERQTMTRQTQQWKPDGLGGYIPLTATSTRTFGQNARPVTGGGSIPSGGPQTPQSVPGKGPIYAYDPKTDSTIMTTQAEAQQNGYTNPRKVTATNIEQDRQLNNRLTDVATKITRYEDAINTPIDVQDRTFMASLLQTDKFKLGAFGAEIPVDKFNELIDAVHQSQLSEAGKNRLISYFNARESMLGYQRVLAGSARSSDAQLGLNLGALPGPISPDSFAKEGIRQFKENIPIAGRGLPRIPGVPTAGDVLSPKMTFKEGNDVYNIPASRVADFKAKHPQAVPSGR
jgi:hypothetical protein